MSQTGGAQTPRVVDSLQQLIGAHPADTAGVRAQLALAAHYFKFDTAQCRRYTQAALPLAIRLHDLAGQARAEAALGVLAQVQGQPLAARSHQQKAIRMYLSQGNLRGASASERAIGSGYAITGQFPEAMRYLLRSLRHSSTAADSAGIAGAYAAIGQTHINMRNYPAALTAYEQALHHWQQLHSTFGVVDAINHLAIIYRDTRRYDQAAAMLQQGLNQAGADSALAQRLLVTMGVLYQKQERWAESLLPLRRAERLLRQDASASLVRRSDFYSLFGTSLVRNGQTAVAAPYLQKALALARQGHMPQEAADALEGLADVAAARGEPAAAFRYERARSVLEDSLHAEKAARQTTELHVRYEAVEREARNQVQAAQLRTQEQTIRRRTTLLVAGTAVALLLAGLAYALYNRQQLRQRLQQQQERQQLERQRAAAVLEAEEAERRRIGADLHDSLGQLLTAARLNLHVLAEELTQGPPEQAQALLAQATGIIDESCRELRGISHNLLPTALLRSGLSTAVRDFLDKVPHQSGLRMELEVFGLDDRLDATLEAVLFRVIQELVQNIIKHARATDVTLQLVQSPLDLTVVVEDNGVGFDPAATSTGMGLRNVQTRVAYLGGQVHFDAVPGRGTTVSLDVPLQKPQAQKQPA